MSLTNGDRSRSQINRKRRIRLRQRVQALRASLEQQAKPAAEPRPAAKRSDARKS
jgi:hypothetical protein